MRRYVILAVMAALASCGGGGGGKTPSPPNSAPAFTSATTATVPENNKAVYQATATDADGDALSFAISGGVDAALFSISTAGALQFKEAPDFERPGDGNEDNVYHVNLSVSDGKASDAIAVTITVTNEKEGIAVRRVATGFAAPTQVAAIPGDTRLFVTEKDGDIYLLDPATGSKLHYMSVTHRWNSIGGPDIPDFSMDGERGLLGIAAAPDYATSGQFFVFMTVADGDIEIRRYERGATGLGDYRTGRALLRIEHSQHDHHYGGWLGFGPDGSLYIATGDGGGSGDPQGNAQNTHSLLGKILRLMKNPDPFGGATPGPSWIAHSGNPFYSGGGAREVFALGLRNPFRASFHGDALIIGDVGEDRVEEIDLMPLSSPGLNFGWPYKEGTLTFSGTAPAGLTDPVTEYLHGSGSRQGGAVVGGSVYRGPATQLQQRYLFGDFVSGNLWSVPAASLQQGKVLPAGEYELRNADLQPDAGTIAQPVSFGEDAAGNLYVVDYDGEVFIIGAT